MECSNCKSVVTDGSKFCNSCGAELKIELNCSNCNTINSAGSKFCNNCGSILSGSSPNAQGEKVILGDEFLISLRIMFFEKLSNRVEQFKDAVDTHTKVRIMDGKSVKREYCSTIRKCFDHLLSSAKAAFTDHDIGRVKNMCSTFLTEDSNELYDQLDILDETTKRVIDEVPNSLLEGLVKGANIGLAQAAVGVLSGGIGTAINLATTFLNSDKVEKKNAALLDEWDSVYSQVGEEFDTLWGKLLEKFDDIEKKTALVFDISDDIWEKYEKDNENPIETIIISNLSQDGSCFLFYDGIPAKKKVGAKSSYLNLDEGEELICLYDSTVFGGAKEGICLSTGAIYWKSISDDEGSCIGYRGLEKTKINKDGDLLINGTKIEKCPMAKQLKKTIDEIIAYVKTLEVKDE